MSFVTAAMIIGGIGAVGAVASSYIGSKAASKAADTQAQAANNAQDLQYKMWQEQNALQAPWRQAGEGALNQLTTLTNNYKPFGAFSFQEDPGYQFRLSEGLKGIDRQAAARGGLISGGALKAAGRYSQDVASQEYQNAFNRYGTNFNQYQIERNAQLNPLQSLAGLGQSSTNMLSNLGMNYANQSGAIGMQGANQSGELGMQGANARASGYVGQANAINNGINQGLNFYQNQQWLNALRPQSQSQSQHPQWPGAGTPWGDPYAGMSEPFPGQ